MSTSTVTPCPSCGTKNRVPTSTTGIPRCASCHRSLPWIVDATAGEFDDAVATSTLPVVVDLWAPWCGPCRMVSPLLEELAADMAGAIKLVKVNVDEAPGISARYGVQGIPTFLLLDHGTEKGRLVGAHPLHELRAWVERMTAP